jgi:hypothetical protein
LKKLTRYKAQDARKKKVQGTRHKKKAQGTSKNQGTRLKEAR